MILTIVILGVAARLLCHAHNEGVARMVEYKLNKNMADMIRRNG